jgi:ComF family protein
VLEPGQFCIACFAATQMISATACRYCSEPFLHASPWGMSQACPRCAAYPPVWRQARAVMRYDGQSKRVILALKHSDRPELAHGLGVMMARAGADLLREADLLVPVPLHPARLRARRYNQAGLLARTVGRVSGVSVLLDALVRVRPTLPLGEMSAEQRARAVAGVFAIRRGRSVMLAGKRIVLVDDVLTSGATATGCTQALLSAGAERVDVLVAARVPDPRQR